MRKQTALAEVLPDGRELIELLHKFAYIKLLHTFLAP